MRPPSRADVLGLLLPIIPLLAAFHGISGANAIRLKLGPGDGPYVSGFTPEWEIAENTAAHWSRKDATIALPLSARGGSVTLEIRYSPPVTVEPPRVDLFVSGAEIDSFAPRDLGLRTEDLRILTSPSTHLSLRGFPLFRPALLVLVVFVAARISGWSASGAALLTLPLALLESYGLFTDPWLVHRLLTGLPEWMGVASILGAAAGRYLVARGRLDEPSLKLAFALGAAAFLFRAALFNHPDYYYSDLRIHAKLAQMVRSAGIDFLLSPAKYIVKHKAWSRVIDQQTYAFPYTPGFHALFAPTGLDTDGLITAMKLAACLATVVPIVMLVTLGSRWGASTLGASLLLFTPIYVHHLGLAYLAALFGHAVDMLFLLWLARHLESIETSRVFALAALLVGCCELAYVTSLIVLPTFLLFLAVFVLATEGRQALRRSTLVLAFGTVGSVLAILVYYRSFAPLVVHALSHVTTGAQVTASDDAPKQDIFFVLWHFTRKYFDYLWTPLALLGAVLLVRRGPGRAMILAWGLTYLVLLAGRARLPFIFQHPHDALFVTPLVCLAAGESVSFAAKGGGLPRRVLALGLYAGLALQGLFVQWEGWLEKLRNLN